MNDEKTRSGSSTVGAYAGVGKGVAKAVRAALAPTGLLVGGYDGIRAYIEGRVAEKLRDLPPKRIRQPNPYVAGPALEALKFAENEEILRELHASLLASAMDAATAANAHPAFVEIIRSMTPDEARVMRLFSSQEPQPVIDVHVQPPDGGCVVVIQNLSLIGREAGCQHVDSSSTYLDNLARLGLLDILPGVHFLDANRYGAVEGVHEVARMKALVAGTNKTVSCQRKTARLTSFGRQFCLACVVDRPAP